MELKIILIVNICWIIGLLLTDITITTLNEKIEKQDKRIQTLETLARIFNEESLNKKQLGYNK